MSTHKSTWKSFERRVAKKLGGKRNPLSGMNSGKPGDVRHSVFTVEWKLRASCIIYKWLDKVKEEAISENKIPLLVVKQKHQKGEYAILELDNFVDLIGDRSNV